MHICAEAPQLHLLAFTGFDRQRVCINPFVRGHVGRLRSIREDVEHRRLVDYGKECDGRNNLFKDGPDLCLNICLRLGGRGCPESRRRSAKINDMFVTYASELLSDDCCTRLISKIQRSSGVRVSLEIMATTSCVTAPVSSHAAYRSHGQCLSNAHNLTTDCLLVSGS